MRNIRLTIEYDGTRFCGWQKQGIRGEVHKRISAKEQCISKKRQRAVQEEIEKAAEKLFGKKIRLIGSGRTDSGVHAEAQIANFRIASNLPLSNIKKGLNSYLPKDIAIVSIEEAPLDFHSQFDAKGKLYRYMIINRDTRPPLIGRYAAFISYNLNISAMRKAAKHLIGRKDFRSFQASEKKERSSIRTIKKLDIVHRSPKIEIYIHADGFLYNMARNIVGTLLDVGRDRIKPEAVKEILSGRCRSLAGQTAPAKGLCLVRVFY